MAHGTNGTKLTRSTETFGDLAPTRSSKTSPRRKPTTFQLGRLRFGKVQEGKESATKKSTSYASRQEYITGGYILLITATKNAESYWMMTKLVRLLDRPALLQLDDAKQQTTQLGSRPQRQMLAKCCQDAFWDAS